MARLRDRLHLPSHVVDQRLSEIVEREGTLVEAPVHETPEREPLVEQPARRPIRWMRWLAGVIVLMAAAGALAVLVLGDGGTERASTYVADPYAELDIISQAVADFEARPGTYVADPYAELDIISQAVADFEARPGTYVADPYAELDIISQAVADFEAS